MMMHVDAMRRGLRENARAGSGGGSNGKGGASGQQLASAQAGRLRRLRMVLATGAGGEKTEARR